MQKVAKGISPTKNWQAALDNINDLEGLRSLYNEAKQGKAPNAILEAIKGKADGINGNKASNKPA
jgi:hypothetical protein